MERSKHKPPARSGPMTTDEAQAFWSLGDGRGEIRSESLPAPGPGHARVRSLYSGISRGTETRVFRGEVPDSERIRMRAPFQVGAFGGPVKYGYCTVGQVESGPADLVGQRVFCLHPHQTRFVVPVAALRPLPASLPAGRAVLAANLETAVNALWDARPAIGDSIRVVGGGVVGMLVAWLAVRIAGCRVELVDPVPARAPVAAALGFAHALPADATPEADLVFHASGRPEGLATALTLAGTEATIVELSWFGACPVTLPLGEAFHARRLRIVSSQVGTLPAEQRSRWDPARRFAFVIDLLGDPTLDRLVNHESDFHTLPELLGRLSRGDPTLADTLCARIRYDCGV